MHPISRSIIERAPRAVRRPVEVAIRTVDGAISDRLPGLAAETSFYVVLSLPALVVAIIAAIPAFVPDLAGQDWEEEFVARTTEVASVALTSATIETINDELLIPLLEGGGVGVVSTAFIAAIWVASRAVKVVLTTAALVYGRESYRPGWLQRLVGFGVTLAALVVGAILAPLLLAGPGFAEQAEEWFEVDLGPLVGIWEVAYWPTVILLAVAAIAVLYRVAVPHRGRWWRDLPGALGAAGVWLLGSAGLRVYGAYLTGTDSVYGPLAGPIVALLWLWLTALAVLLGAELNAQLDRSAHVHDDAEISAAGVVTDDTDITSALPEGRRSGTAPRPTRSPPP